MHPAPAPAVSRARLVLAVAAAVGAMLLYGGQFVLSRWSMQRTLPLWDLAALRFTVAGLLCLPLALRRPVAGGIGWGRLAVLAVCAGGPYTLVMYTGLVLAPAAHGAVIITGATPVVGVVLARLWLGERARPATLVAMAVIVAGLVLVGWPGLRGGAGSTVWLGDLLFVVAGVLWALYTVAVRRWRADPLRVTAAVWALALLYVPVYLLVVGGRLLDAPRGEVVFQGIYQGVGVAIVALVLYSFAIRVLGAARAALFMPLTPVFGVLLAVPVLGEVPAAVQVVGMLAVGGGMLAAAAQRNLSG